MFYVLKMEHTLGGETYIDSTNKRVSV